MVPTAASTVLRLDPPFRAEHVGSLLRPPQLLERRAQFDAKQCTAEELKAEEDAAIAAAVKFQQEVGIQSITDGEMRRGFFYEGMFEKLEGMENIVRPIETFSVGAARSVIISELKL
ncbi:hypothetical protein PHLCEN_2v551 [Hermanssonia centrifuga]|uniref:Methionine synthase n=1 Tax=Hermanssonia centrifuga TaxID=98765 RepID=A0A2R6S5R5_9APHY|nr:hypothetical protein PHLCEN_2v551 [Hermanssonia centrifuga]